MYQRFPGEARSDEPSPVRGIPQSVQRAVRVMYIGLAASLLGIVVDMTTLSSTRSEILSATRATPRRSSTTPSTWRSACSSRAA